MVEVRSGPRQFHFLLLEDNVSLLEIAKGPVVQLRAVAHQEKGVLPVNLKRTVHGDVFRGSYA